MGHSGSGLLGEAGDTYLPSHPLWCREHIGRRTPGPGEIVPLFLFWQWQPHLGHCTWPSLCLCGCRTPRVITTQPLSLQLGPVLAEAHWVEFEVSCTVLASHTSFPYSLLMRGALWISAGHMSPGCGSVHTPGPGGLMPGPGKEDSSH